MIDLTKLKESFQIDTAKPIKRGRTCDFYTSVNGGTVTIYRYWYHRYFKNGKPPKIKKSKRTL